MNYKRVLRAISLILGGIGASFAANSWLLELRHNVTAFSADLSTYLIWLYIFSSTLMIVIALIACSFQWDTYTSIQAEPLRDLPLSDRADVAIVSSALNGAADVLVTDDKEILNLRRVGSLQILTPRQFWDKERGQQGGRVR